MNNFFRIIIKFIYRIIAEIMYRPRVKGKENLPKESGAILCPNHVHALDSTIVIATAKRKVNVLAKDRFFRSKIGKWFANVFGIYPVKEDKKSIYTLKISLKLLKNKELLMIFPEGTRNGLSKGIKPRDGAIKIAITAKVPIIPIGIQGSFKIFRKVKVNIGKPIDYLKYKDKINDKEFMNKLTEELMDKIIELRDEKIK